MKGFIGAITVVLTVAVTPAFSEDEMRDFYAEPGMNLYRTSAGQDATESIDPFSGNVQLSYVDLSIPGNGGLDINITRYYNLPQSSPGYANPFGYGWTMHFGRITIGSGHAKQLCGAGAAAGGDTLDNPSLEMPSGGRELLVHSSTLNDGTYITKSNWKAACIDPDDYTRGIVATAPNGTSYHMREYVFMQGEDGPAGEAAPTVETWLTSQIVDPHGNTLDMTYKSVASGMKLLTRVDASDGREVIFNYLDANDAPVTADSVNARLSTMKANGRTWQYEYAPFSGGTTGWGFVDHYKLKSLVRPDGTSWDYHYGTAVSEPEYNRLTRVTYPAGGQISYSYQRVQPYLPNPDFYIFAIKAKTQSNPGRPEGTWTYEFFPGAVDFADLGVEPVAENAGRMADFTRITTPAGVEHIYHVGYWALVGTYNILWEMGLKIRHQYLAVDRGNGSLRPVRSVSNSWAFRAISDEVYRGGILSELWDSKTYAPMLAGQVTVLDGYSYLVRYTNHDTFGNPRQTTQYSIYPTENGDRVIDTAYLNNTDRWIIGLPETETTRQDDSVVGTIVRSYNEKGSLQTEERFGVATLYDYTPEGDVASITDARGYTSSYSNYFRGIAQLEQLPDGSQRTMTVNTTGTVASKTSGRGHTTAFTYDGLNRLTGIDYPLGSDVSIDWSATGKTLTRGAYREVLDWDGFGRDIRLTRQDLMSGNNYINNYDYDESGRRVFTSDVNSPNGIGWEYDAIGRKTRVINQDGTDTVVTYEGAHRELHRDENNNVIDYRYQVYGSPEYRHLSWTISPEGVVTHIGRDAYGNIASIFQGGLDPDDPQQYLGYVQSFGYNSRLQLTSIDSPADIGLTIYGRDILGNMTSRKVGAGVAAIYNYDAMNRISIVDYVDDALDIAYDYDQDGKVFSIANSYATRTFGYNQNGGLVSEDIAMEGANYQVSYTRDELDNVSLVTYPSGRTLDYSPDALGRPTQAWPYLSRVDYHPDGSVQKMSYANGHTMAFTKTIRNQADTLSIAGLLALDYDYDPAGNVTALSDLLGSSFNKTMTYDGLHRLKTVAGNWGTSHYEYDNYSNILHKNDPTRSNRTEHYQYQGLMLDQITYSGAPAQRGFSYDDHGNITYSDDVVYDVFTGFPLEIRTTRRHVFDEAGNMVFSQRTAKNELGDIVATKSGSFSSEYDGKNNRIRKINHSDGNRVTQYVYSDAGILLGEYDEAGAYYGNEYFYLGSKQIATAKINSPPLVNAGEDIQTFGGLRVSLSATQSDPDGEVVIVEWTQVSGPTVTIDDPTSSSTFFTSPQSVSESTIVLRYTVTDDRGAVATQLLEILVGVNRAPTANAGLDISVLAGTPAHLDGSGSFDTQGPVTYHWSGPDLSDATVVNPLVQPPELGYNYSRDYTLTVTNSQGETATDMVALHVLSKRLDADLDNLPDGWEIIHFGDVSSFSASDDPDGDGVLNTQELRDNTNPNTADTPAPVIELGLVRGEGRNVLVWERSVAAAHYTVFWTTAPGSSIDSWSQTNVTERFFEHPGLDNGQEYYYAVAAVNAMGSAAVSPVVSGDPGSPSWQLAERQPDALTGFDAASTRVASNRFGDTVILAEKYDGGLYRLYAWQRSIFGEWSDPEVVDEDSSPHYFFSVDIDDNGNVIVSWTMGVSGSRSLYGAYRPYARSFEPGEIIESYKAEGDADADVVSLSHLEFTDSGLAYICWRQNRLHAFNDVADPDGASALVKQFHPVRGWTAEHNLEVLNNAGNTLNLSCDVSSDGHVVAAWERYNSFDPGTPPSGSLDYDIWVAAYSPEGGWADSETVEFLKDGSREDGGFGTQNHLPRVAVNNDGRAAVAWYNATDVNVELLEFDFVGGGWLSQETLESRGKQIRSVDSHRLAASESGDLLVAWGNKFTTRSSGATSWSRPSSLPAETARLGIDESGQAYSVHLSDTDIIASRYVDGAWTSQSLNAAAVAGDKVILQMGSQISDALSVHWLSGSALMHSSDVVTNTVLDDAPDATPPVTTFTAQVKKVKGKHRYTIDLEVNEAAAIHFRFSGQGQIAGGGADITDWQAYTLPVEIQLDKKGTGSFEFYSQDLAGNVETIQTEILQ